MNDRIRPGSFRTRSPHDPPGYMSVDTLTGWWHAARHRTLLARYGSPVTPADVEDYWTEIAVGTRIAREVMAGRWCVVAELLRAGAVESWAQVGTALDISETEARDGFHGWIAGQVALYRRTGSIGITESAAEQLYRLSEAVVW